MESQPVADEGTTRVGMYEEEFKKFNWTLLALELVLFAIGILNLHSATAVEDKASGLYKTQLLWFGIGMGLTALILLVHYSLLGWLTSFTSPIWFFWALFCWSENLRWERSDGSVSEAFASSPPSS